MPLAMASHRDHAARMTTPISAATARPKSTANAKVRMKSTAVLSGCRPVIRKMSMSKPVSPTSTARATTSTMRRPGDGFGKVEAVG